MLMLTGGRKNFMTEIRPYIPTSFNGLSPSGVTKCISNLVFLARIKFKSLGEVKFPEKKRKETHVHLHMHLAKYLLIMKKIIPVTHAVTAVGF